MKRQPLKQQKSLHDVMNDMVRKPPVLLPERTVAPTAEAEAFLSIDQLLASLHKQMLDAQARHRKLKKQNGPADPMTAIAADMVDSARTAVETRLIELRNDRAKVLQARRIVKKALADEEEERQMASLRYRMRLQMFYEEQRAQEKISREEEESSKWLLFFIWLIQVTTQQAKFRNSLAFHFSGVSRFKEAA